MKMKTKIRARMINKRKRWRARWWILAVGMVVAMSGIPTSGSFALVDGGGGDGRVAAAASTCSDVNFVFARGSGEPLGGASATEWQASIEEVMKGQKNLRYDFYELGSRSQQGFRYPAVEINLETATQAYFSAGEAYAFGNSVVEGAAELRSYLRSVARACPQTKFVLGGYSQGAMVVSRTLPEIEPDKIIYAATFGDPKLYLPEGEGMMPPACRGQNLSNYRVDVPDCYVYEGILGSYRPYQPVGYRDKLGVWCNNHDVICSARMSIADHTAYVAEQKYRAAAEVIAQKIQETWPNIEIFQPLGTSGPLHDVVFLFDSTGSMKPMIERYQAQAQKLAQNVIEAGGRVALYEYRDLDDPFVARQLCDFNCDLDSLSEKIDQIQPAGGGDTRESALSAAMTAMNELEWRFGANKSIVILSDAPYLNPDRDGTTLKEVEKRSLEIDPVNIYTITTSGQRHFFRSLAEATDGAVFDIDTELELSSDWIFQRPNVRLPREEYSGQAGDEFYFDAAASEMTRKAELSFDWDLDGDGEYEYKNTGAQMTQRYARSGEFYIRVRARDEVGRTSTMSAKVEVGLAEEHRSTISDVKIAAEAENYEVSFKTAAEKIFVSLDEASLGFIARQEGEQQIRLSGVKAGTELTLIPYDQAGWRGQATRIRLDGENSMMLPTQQPSQIPEESNPIQSEEPTKQPAEPAKRPTEAPESHTETTPASATKKRWPKVPNAGTVKSSAN